MMGHHDGESHLGQRIGQRIWTSVYVSGFFFFGVSLAALFFLAVQYAAEAGWAVVFKRIMEGIVSAYSPYWCRDAYCRVRGWFAMHLASYLPLDGP